MNIQVFTINDEILSSERYEVHLNGKFYSGNNTKKGLQETLRIIEKKYGVKYENYQSGPNL